MKKGSNFDMPSVMDPKYYFRVRERTLILEEYLAYSQDLSPPDYFLWGYLKDRVYKNNPRTIKDLKNNIRKEIRQISAETHGRVMANFARRLNNVIETHGKWFEYALNY